MAITNSGASALIRASEDMTRRLLGKAQMIAEEEGGDITENVVLRAKSKLLFGDNEVSITIQAKRGEETVEYDLRKVVVNWLDRIKQDGEATWREQAAERFLESKREVFTVRGVAAILGVTENTVTKLLSRNQMDYYSVGQGAHRIRRIKLQSFIENNDSFFLEEEHFVQTAPRA